MEEEVWKQLPEDLILKLVDDHLPLEAQCRLRSVCKAWKSPRLRPESLHGLYIRKDAEHKGLCLYDKKAGKYQTLLRKGSFKHKFGNCVNGFLAAMFVNLQMKSQVFYAVFNIFRPGWRRLPRPPPAPGRACFFAALSKKPGAPPRIGMSNLADYFFMLAMGNHNWLHVPATSLVLQVYNAGKWSCGLVELPPGHSLIHCRAFHYKCGVLRGSEFLFLTMHSDDTEVSLCSVDVVAEHKRCKVLCGLKREFVTEWRFSTMNLPNLALCSEKLLLVHRQDLPGGEHTFGVEELDEEKLQWRLISSMPLDFKAPDSNPKYFHPAAITFGGDELVIYDGHGKGYLYNVVTGAWSPTREILYPISYQP